MLASIRWRRLVLGMLGTLAVLAVVTIVVGRSSRTWYVLRDPVARDELTGLPFGFRSQWLQPWRSSLTTRSAMSLQAALGMNFNVAPSQADATARLLADSGVHRVRIELAWDGMSYGDPAQISAGVAASWRTEIAAFRRHGLRPLILLNGNSGLPGPYLEVGLNLVAAAPAGARLVQLAPASAAQVVPGLTGINAAGDAAGVLITGVDAAGVATLSRPLPSSLAAGVVGATTLRYAPFAPPRLADGAPNPRFAQTLAGWLTYVRSVCDFVRGVYGSDRFDVEVWNELSFGSDFLNEANYDNPVPDSGSTGDTDAAILAATVQMLHDPATGFPDVKVGDGFANQTPFVSGATVPAGTDAIDHHPYAGFTPYPGATSEPGVIPLNARGRPAYHLVGGRTPVAAFTPHYIAFFPEYYLTGIQTETLMRDLSPITTAIRGTPYGASTHPAGGAPPANWITEDNLDVGVARSLGMPAADLPEFQAKTALRFYVAYASEGAAAIDLYAAAGGGCCELIAPTFLARVAADPSVYPGDSAGGLPMQAVARMVRALRGAQVIAHPRQLSLDAIASDNDSDVQFRGDGTPAFPSLYNRDVLAFFPFQVSAHRFVSAVYVMTRDLAMRYTNHPAAGQTPFDLPPEAVRLTIGGVNGAHARVSLTDPLTGRPAAASIVARAPHRIIVQLSATDSPRLLTITEQR